MHLRPHAVSAGSVACRVVDSPVGTLDARSCHALPAHGSPHNAAVPGLEVSRGDVLQHQLVQAQLSYQTLQLRVLLLQLFQPSRLVDLQTAKLLAPAVVSLFRDPHFLAGLRRQLPIRRPHLNLPQQTYNLLRRMFLSSCHAKLLSYQFASSLLVQESPGTPLAHLSRSSAENFLTTSPQQISRLTN